MFNLARKKLGLIAAGSALVLALASVPAKAHHNHSIVDPAVAFIALGALLHHSHHGYYRQHYKRYHRHQYKRHHRYDHSHGGYHKKRRQHYDDDYDDD